MLSSHGGHNMRGRFNRKDTYWETDVPTAVEVESPGELSPLPGGSTSSDWPDTPVSGSAHTHPEEPDPPVSGSAHMGLDHPHQKSKFAMTTSYPNMRCINMHRHAGHQGQLSFEL